MLHVLYFILWLNIEDILTPYLRNVLYPLIEYREGILTHYLYAACNVWHSGIEYTRHSDTLSSRYMMYGILQYNIEDILICYVHAMYMLCTCSCRSARSWRSLFMKGSSTAKWRRTSFGMCSTKARPRLWGICFWPLWAAVRQVLSRHTTNPTRPTRPARMRIMLLITYITVCVCVCVCVCVSISFFRVRLSVWTLNGHEDTLLQMTNLLQMTLTPYIPPRSERTFWIKTSENFMTGVVRRHIRLWGGFG